MSDRIDFRVATNAEIGEWFKRQASRCDDSMATSRSDAERLEYTAAFLAIVAGLVGELFKRLGDDGTRPARVGEQPNRRAGETTP